MIDLKQYLHENNLTQIECAKLLDVHIDTVSKWIHGKRNMPLNLFKLLQILIILRQQ